jgi:hypothetical protein
MEIFMFIRRVSMIPVIAITLVGFAGAANAAGCYDGAQALTPSAISSFMSNPGDLISKSPQGGGSLTAGVRDLAASDSATLPAITGLLKNANDDQKRAIGAGLAQAARVCVAKDPAYANQIQQAVADSKDPVFTLAYAAGAGNNPIGAGAGGGSPGASGGATTGFGTPTGTGGGAEGIGGNGVNTGQFSYYASTNSANSVSP